MVLTKRPTATVTVEISGAAGDVRLSRTRLSFSTSNWNRDQTVTVSLSEDDDAIQDVAVTLTHEVTGADEYEEADPPIVISSVSVILKENDTRGVTVNPMSLTVAAGGSGTYSVSLNTEPTDAVTVVVNSPSDDVDRERLAADLHAAKTGALRSDRDGDGGRGTPAAKRRCR